MVHATTPNTTQTSEKALRHALKNGKADSRNVPPTLVSDPFFKEWVRHALSGHKATSYGHPEGFNEHTKRLTALYCNSANETFKHEVDACILRCSNRLTSYALSLAAGNLGAGCMPSGHTSDGITIIKLSEVAGLRPDDTAGLCANVIQSCNTKSISATETVAVLAWIIRLEPSLRVHSKPNRFLPEQHLRAYHSDTETEIHVDNAARLSASRQFVKDAIEKITVLVELSKQEKELVRNYLDLQTIIQSLMDTDDDNHPELQLCLNTLTQGFEDKMRQNTLTMEEVSQFHSQYQTMMTQAFLVDLEAKERARCSLHLHGPFLSAVNSIAETSEGDSLKNLLTVLCLYLTTHRSRFCAARLRSLTSLIEASPSEASPSRKASIADLAYSYVEQNLPLQKAICSLAEAISNINKNKRDLSTLRQLTDSLSVLLQAPRSRFMRGVFSRLPGQTPGSQLFSALTDFIDSSYNTTELTLDTNSINRVLAVISTYLAKQGVREVFPELVADFPEETTATNYVEALEAAAGDSSQLSMIFTDIVTQQKPGVTRSKAMTASGGAGDGLEMSSTQMR